MKNLLISLVVLFFFLAGGTASAGPVSIKMSFGSCPIGHPMLKATEDFNKWIQEKSGGKYTLALLPSGTIGNFDTVFQGVQMGSVPIAVETTSNLATFYPEFSVFDLPYLFKNDDNAKQFLKSDFFEQAIKEMEKKRPGIAIIGANSTGFRYVVSKAQYKTLAELQGKKDRVSGNRLHAAAIKAMGMNPTPTSAAEILSSLQQGVVDTVDCEIFWPPTARLYDVAKYYLRIDAMPVFYATTVSTAWLKKLSEADRAMWLEGLSWYVEQANEVIAKKYIEVIGFLEKEGCVFSDMSAEDKVAAASKVAGLEEGLSANQKSYLEKMKKAL